MSRSMKKSMVGKIRSLLGSRTKLLQAMASLSLCLTTVTLEQKERTPMKTEMRAPTLINLSSLAPARVLIQIAIQATVLTAVAATRLIMLTLRLTLVVTWAASLGLVMAPLATILMIPMRTTQTTVARTMSPARMLERPSGAFVSLHLIHKEVSPGLTFQSISVLTRPVSNGREGFVDGPPPGRPGADRWIISEREVAAAVAEQAGRSAEYSSDDPRNSEYGNGNSNHTGDTNSFNYDGGPSASLRNHGGWGDSNPFANGNGVAAPVANGANWQIQARAQGMGSESNIDEDSDELPSTADPASPRWEQVDPDVDENVPANPGHNLGHSPQPPPAPVEPDNGQPPMSPFILRPLGLPRELYTPPPLPPWSPLILPRPFTGENAPFPQRRGSVHGGFAVPNANQWTYSDDSDSEFGMADYFTGQVEFGPVNWNSASISGARNEMALSPLSCSFRDIAGRRREFQPDFRANILFESLYPAHVGGNESEDLPDYESPDEPSRPTTSGVPVMPQEDYNDPDNLPDYESSEELAPQTSYHNGVVERNGRFESEDLSGYESDEDSPPTQQPWSSRRPERFASRASAAASAARALLLDEQAAQDEGPNGAAAGDTDSSDFGSISDSSSRSSSEDDEGDNSTDDDDSQEPPAPPVPTGGSSESGDDGGCAPSRYPDSPPPSPGGCGGTIPVAAENDHGRTQTWIDVYGEAVTAFEGADFAEARGNKRKSSELGDEDTAPGVPQAGKRRRLTDEPGSSALSTPSPRLKSLQIQL